MKKSLKLSELFFQTQEKFAEFEWYTAPERRGATWGINYVWAKEEQKYSNSLSRKMQSTRCELATEFNVSTDTIDRDIVYLSGIAPVYTKQGNQGGVYILPEYRSYKNYLTDEEEECLYSLIKKSANDERRIICGIITKFTKNIITYK